MVDFLLVLGLAAAACTTSAFLPQVVKTWRTRRTDDLALGMYLLFCVGVALWLVYGLFIRDVPIVAANVVTLLLASTVLFFKVRYG